jgi:HlyD family secretion protein
MKTILQRILTTLTLVAIAILIALAFRPKPVAVETARAVNGPLQVTVDEDGETRAHDRFTVAAPVAGRLSRIELHEGDEVGPGTLIATISPLPLDPREAAEVRARVDAAEARRREAEQQYGRSESDLAQARRDADRARLLMKDRIIARQDLEQAETRLASTTRDMEAARFRLQATTADLERERAGLIALEQQQQLRQPQTARMVPIRSATRGRVLRILEKSERVVPNGTPLLVLSNPNQLEIVIDLLSTDAVKVKAGAPVIVENWGGPKPLRARVRLVEPYGFTKVSALGIEEQRVNVIADFVDPPAGLGDGYRVDGRIVIWESANVLKVPASALFRTGQQWSVFIVENGRTRIVPVEVGQRNAFEAEITSGLVEGTEVVLHPASDLRNDTRVTPC